MLTSCAEDFVTWDDVLPAGEESISGVTSTVCRHCRASPVVPSSFGLAPGRSDPCLAADAEKWVDLQGPVVPDLVARRSRCPSRRVDLLPLPLLSDRPAHRASPGPHRAASGGPRRTGPAPPRLPPCVHRRRRAGLPDGRRAATGAGTLSGGHPSPAPVGAGCRRRAAWPSPRRRRSFVRRPPVPGLFGPGGEAQRDLVTGPACSPSTRAAAPGRCAWCWSARWSRPRSSPRHRRRRSGVRGGEMEPAGRCPGPGIAVALGGLLLGGG